MKLYNFLIGGVPVNVIKAAICEDKLPHMKYIAERLRTHFMQQEITLSLKCFTDSHLLLENLAQDNYYDILFLDIEMPELNGIELSHQVRSFDSEVMVIFISSKEELVFQSFEVRPFRFVRKNHLDEELPQLVLDIIREMANRQSSTITIHEDKSAKVYLFSIKEIHYIEVMGKLCHVVTDKRNVQLRQRLSDFQEKLADRGFLQPHRSYLVNYRFIFNIGKTAILLDDQTEIPLSRNRVETIKEQFIILTRGGAL